MRTPHTRSRLQMVAKVPPSWKQKKPTPPPAVVGLKQRRLVSTVALLTVIALAVVFVYWLINQHTQETWIVHVGKSARDNQFALPPIRFVDKAWLELSSSVKTNYLHFEPVESLDIEKMESSILKIQKQSTKQSQDALIVWIDGVGIAHQGNPFILGNQFRLPNDPQHFDADADLISIDTVLTKLSTWPGPKLLILDWGQEVFDPRIDLIGNDFVSALEKAVVKFRTKDDSTNSDCWVLISHLQGQISLVDDQARQSIFGRAVREGLVNQRQTPPVDASERAKLTKSKHLNLASLAEYVHRRVAADSQNFQTPWLLRTGSGLVPNDEFRAAKDVTLVAIDAKTGNPLEVTSSRKADAKTSADSDSKGNQVSSPVVDSATAKNLQELWSALDRWRTVSFEQGNEGWSEAALAPLAYKSIAAQVLDVDLHAYAGVDVFSESRDLVALIQSVKRRQPIPSLALGPDVRTSDSEAYSQAYTKLRDQRQWACLYIDALKLVASLKVFAKALDLSADLNRISDSFERQEPDAPRVLSEAIDSSIGTLVKHENKGVASAFAEIFLRSLVLNSSQRQKLRELQSQLRLQPGEQNLHWHDKTLVTPEIVSVNQSWPPDIKSNIGAELVRRLIASTGAAHLEIDAIAKADPRDVQLGLDKGNVAKFVEMGKEFPAFPVRPDPPSQWLIQWGDADAPLVTNGNSIQVEINKDVPLTLLVKKTGSQQLSFPRLRLAPENVGVFVNGRQYDFGESVELDEAWFERQGSALQLPIKIHRSDNLDAANIATLSLETTESSVKKRPEPLIFDLPTNNPIEFRIGQRLLRNGKPTTQMVKAQSRFTLTPFSGRESLFQFEIKNVDSRPHSVDIRFFSVPVDDSDSEATVGSVSGRPNLRGRVPDCVWKIDAIAAGQVEKVKLATPTAPSAATPKDGATTEKTAPPPASEQAIDISGGAVIQLLVDDKPPKEFVVNFSPKNVSDYINTSVNYDDKGTLSINTAWSDQDEDGLADIAPIDLSPEKPLRLKWDYLPWQSANANITTGPLVLKTPKVEVQSIRSSELKIDRDFQEVWINVDDTPRSLIFAVGRNARGEVSRPSDRKKNFRCLWRQYVLTEEGKPVFSYVPHLVSSNAKNVKQIVAPRNAVFGDLKGTVQIQLAVDLPSGERCKVLRKGIPIADNQLDRNIVAELRCKGDEIAIKWAESDLQFTLDFSNDIIAQDSEFKLAFLRIGAQPDDNLTSPALPSIVADIEAPKLSTSVPATLSEWLADMGADRRINLTCQVKDRSDVVQAMVIAQKRGTPIQIPMSGAEKLLPDKTSKIALDVSKLDVGEYNILIRMEDAFKHEYTHQLQKPLRINKPVAPADAKAEKTVIRGDLKVQAAFANKTRVVRNDVKFEMEPAAEKETRASMGEMVYEQVELGTYKVTLNYEEGNKKYKGTKSIELKKKEDFAKTYVTELILVE